MRIFVALSLPQTAVDMLCAVQDRLLESGSGGRLVPPENMHITLRFLGELDSAATATLCDIVQEQFAHFPAPLISMDGVGAYVRTGGDTVYAHLGGNFDAIVDAHKKLTRALQEVGIQPDLRPFSPHITLIRNAAFGSKMLNARSETFFCQSICVYSSVTGPGGSAYEKLNEVLLPR